MNANQKRPAPSKNEQTITSLEIAKISGVTHANLLKFIKKQEVAWRKVNEVNFHLVKYKDKKGEKRPMYELTQTESLYISSKFNDEARARLVLRWYDLEEKAQNSKSILELYSFRNSKQTLPVVDVPMEIELLNDAPVRSYTVKGTKLTLIIDLVRAYRLSARAYKQAKNANKGAVKAIKVLDFYGQTVWAVNNLGRKVLCGQLAYRSVMQNNQLKLGL